MNSKIFKSSILSLFMILFFAIDSMEHEYPFFIFLDDHINQAIKELPAKSDEGISLVKEFLNEIKTLISKFGSISDILERLHDIKTFALNQEYQKERFNSPTYQTEITLAKFVELFIDPIIEVIKKENSTNKDQIEKTVIMNSQNKIYENKNIVPIGLVNSDKEFAIGNRCFINAAIQCLFALKDINNILLNLKNTEYYTADSITQNYIKLISQMLQSKSNINALDFSLQIWHSMEMDPAKQADSGELVQKLLKHIINEDISINTENKLAKDLIGFELTSLRLIGEVSNIKMEQLAQKQTIFEYLTKNHPEVKSLTLSQFIDKQKNLEEMLKNYPEVDLILYESNIAKSLFSKLLPTDQQQNIVNKKIQIALTLPLQSNQKNIIQCLDSFFEAQEVSQSDDLLNQFNQYVYRLNNVGKYFLISLNRNSYDKTKKTALRIETPISFILNNLDISRYCDSTAGKYSLIACLMHSGGTSGNGGHYTAYTKHSDKWYFCDDTQIKLISTKEMDDIAKRGYGLNKHHVPTMLFYQKN